LLRRVCAELHHSATKPAPLRAKITHLYYVDLIEGIAYFVSLIEPQFLIENSSKLDLKLKTLECHASQRKWPLQQHGIDGHLDSYRKWSTIRKKTGRGLWRSIHPALRTPVPA